MLKVFQTDVTGWGNVCENRCQLLCTRLQSSVHSPVNDTYYEIQQMFLVCWELWFSPSITLHIAAVQFYICYIWMTACNESLVMSVWSNKPNHNPIDWPLVIKVTWLGKHTCFMKYFLLTFMLTGCGWSWEGLFIWFCTVMLYNKSHLITWKSAFSTSLYLYMEL